jgi:hypothetical protein
MIGSGQNCIHCSASSDILCLTGLLGWEMELGMGEWLSEEFRKSVTSYGI